MFEALVVGIVTTLFNAGVGCVLGGLLWRCARVGNPKLWPRSKPFLIGGAILGVIWTILVECGRYVGEGNAAY